MDKQTTETILLFENMFTSYLTKRNDEGDLSLHVKKLNAGKKHLNTVEAFDIDKDGSVSITASKKANADSLSSELATLFDSMLDVTVYKIGMEEALEFGKRVVATSRRSHQELFEELELGKSILKGAISDYTSMGIEGMEKILPDGIPNGSVILLIAPSGGERYRLMESFLAHGIRFGASGLILTSRMAPTTVKGNMLKENIKASTYEKRGYLATVDWYSYKRGTVVGVEAGKGIVKASKDISNLDIAIEKAIDSLKPAPTKRAFLDVLSPALTIYDLKDVYDFFNKEAIKLKSNGFTSVFLLDYLEENMSAISSLRQIADGVINIRREESDSGPVLTISAEAIKGVRIGTEKKVLITTATGLKVSEHVNTERLIKRFMDIPGMDKKGATALLEDGFRSIASLSRADQDSLKKTHGLDKSSVKAVVNFIGSPEFTQALLYEKSDAWHLRAEEYLKEDAIDKAEDALQRAIEIHSENSDAWYLLGQIMYDDGRVDSARKCYERAKSNDPSLMGKWYGGHEEQKEVFRCTTCSSVVEEVSASCPVCGVSFTTEERNALKETLNKNKEEGEDA